MNSDVVRMCVGYDSQTVVAFTAMCHSIHRHSSRPVSIMPVMLSQLNGIFNRERDPLQSTEFSFTRFLTPYLYDYEGWVIFTDNDMILRDDIANLWDLRDDRYAVMCVHHDYMPEESTKFLGKTQTRYQKKNWSSVMMFNCAKCTALTPKYVNTAPGLELHQFKWLEDDNLIGELPGRWNHLVNVNEPRDDAALVHYTVGGPFFDDRRDCEYAREWFKERAAALKCDQLRMSAKTDVR